MPTVREETTLTSRGPVEFLVHSIEPPVIAWDIIRKEAARLDSDIRRLTNDRAEMLEALKRAVPYLESFTVGLERIPEADGGDPLYDLVDNINALISRIEG